MEEENWQERERTGKRMRNTMRVCMCVFKAKVISFFQQERRWAVSSFARDQALFEVTRSLDRRELLTLIIKIRCGAFLIILG